MINTAFAKLRIYNNIKEVENEEEFESYWEISDGENNIKVRPINNEIKLYINDKLQDVISNEVKCATLNGKLTNGKEVKVAITLINSHVIHCYIFVDNECVLGE